jgi:diketogulonate reductase-like aldo/keto reductase
MNRTIALNNKKNIPVLGLGVWNMAKGKETEQAVLWALETGYRHIDTAKVYANEQEVGEAIRKSGISRKEIFVTTKLWNDDQGYESGLAAMDRSLSKLQMDYVDLYLIHWPLLQWSEMDIKAPNKRAETWKAMEEIYRSGKAKTIGVSNYTIEHLEEMKTYSTVDPAVNQVEFHPFLYRKELMEYCHKRNIAIEDYCPLTRGRKLQDERITTISKKYNKSNAQVLIRWGLQHGNIVIPKSAKKERIKENFDVFDFEISEPDMSRLDSLNENYSVVFT